MKSPTTATCSELSLTVKPFIQRHVKTVFIIVCLYSIWMGFSNKPGALGLGLIACGSLLPGFLWAKQSLPGIPIAPLMGIQTLVIFGFPLAMGNESLELYSPQRINQAAIEVFVFGTAIAIGWSIVTKHIRPRSPKYFRAFSLLKSGGSNKLLEVGLLMMSISISFLVANMEGLTGLLVGGTFSIVRTIADALGLGGGLISAFLIGAKASQKWHVVTFWILYTAYTFMIISNYTLFPATSMMMAVALGFFMGHGRLPFVFLGIMVSVLSVLNLSKFDMRENYWTEGSAYAYQRLSDLPERYVEWAELGYDRLTKSDSDKSGTVEDDGQRLSNRVDSLVIVLRAQQAILGNNTSLLYGETYSIIPPLFIPRFLWPEKPRTHEGMVILNVHFGQQTREESLTTYISWGILPEAYANYGTIMGPLIIGIILGIALGWVENWSRFFPLASLQTLVVLTFTINCASSFESVSSVWLTSVFQMIVALTVGLWFFTDSQRIYRITP